MAAMAHQHPVRRRADDPTKLNQPDRRDPEVDHAGRGLEHPLFAQQMQGMTAGAIQFLTIPIVNITYYTPSDGDAVEVDPTQVQAVRAHLVSNADNPQSAASSSQHDEAAAADANAEQRRHHHRGLQRHRHHNLGRHVMKALTSQGFTSGGTGNSAPCPHVHRDRLRARRPGQRGEGGHGAGRRHHGRCRTARCPPARSACTWAPATPARRARRATRQHRGPSSCRRSTAPPTSAHHGERHGRCRLHQPRNFTSSSVTVSGASWCGKCPTPASDRNATAGGSHSRDASAVDSSRYGSSAPCTCIDGHVSLRSSSSANRRPSPRACDRTAHRKYSIELCATPGTRIAARSASATSANSGADRPPWTAPLPQQPFHRGGVVGDQAAFGTIGSCARNSWASAAAWPSGPPEDTAPHGGTQRQRMRRRDSGHGRDQPGMQRGDRPRDHAAPRVPDEVRPRLPSALISPATSPASVQPS